MPALLDRAGSSEMGSGHLELGAFVMHHLLPFGTSRGQQ